MLSFAKVDVISISNRVKDYLYTMKPRPMFTKSQLNRVNDEYRVHDLTQPSNDASKYYVDQSRLYSYKRYVPDMKRRRFYYNGHQSQGRSDLTFVNSYATHLLS